MTRDFAVGGRLELRITPADVGKRVSVRRLLESSGGRPTFTDTVGVLVSWDDMVVCVTRRDGETVRIPESLVVAGKVVPEAPARRVPRVPRVSAEELQETASGCWPPTWTTRLGDWTLRSTVEPRERPGADRGGRRAGFTRRTDSVLAHGDPGLPLDGALELTERWYDERGATAYLQVVDDSPLVAELDRRGWQAEAHGVILTAPLAPLAALPGADRATVGREPDEASQSACHRTGELAAEELRVVSGGPPVWFATAPGAIGRCAVDGRWALFGAVEVEPAQRRAGPATAVTAALARQALHEGASAACLQVEGDNAGARAFYEEMGFTTHHAYHYRRAPGHGNG